jgi:hypothetical protein
VSRYQRTILREVLWSNLTARCTEVPTAFLPSY